MASRKKSPAAADRSLRIVVIVPDPADHEPDDPVAQRQDMRSRALRIGLLQAGCNLVATLPADPFLADRVSQLRPDLIIVDAESEARDALEHVVFATRDERRPIVMFTDDQDTRHVREAMAIGVTAYIVDGLESRRIRPILDIAMARFDYEERLRIERDDARQALSERTVIERAKQWLMQHQKLSEPQAHARMQQAAMEQGLRMAEVARRLIDASSLLK